MHAAAPSPRLPTANAWVRGRVGDVVFKTYGRKIVISRVPRFDGRPPTAAQRARRDKMRAATAFAKRVYADPAAKAFYITAAQALGKKPLRLAVSDHLAHHARVSAAERILNPRHPESATPARAGAAAGGARQSRAWLRTSSRSCVFRTSICGPATVRVHPSCCSCSWKSRGVRLPLKLRVLSTLQCSWFLRLMFEQRPMEAGLRRLARRWPQSDRDLFELHFVEGFEAGEVALITRQVPARIATRHIAEPALA